MRTRIKVTEFNSGVRQYKAIVIEFDWSKFFTLLSIPVIGWYFLLICCPALLKTTVIFCTQTREENEYETILERAKKSIDDHIKNKKKEQAEKFARKVKSNTNIKYP